MTENAENLILEQLRLLPGDMLDMRSEMDRRFDGVDDRLGDVEATRQGMQAILIGFGQHMGLIDHRVEKLEQKIGGDQ
jgi:hypothetical protein